MCFSAQHLTVVVSGLDQNRKYHFKVFEYNGTGGFQNYLITSAPADSQHTYLLVDVQLWLEGAFNGSDMDADLIDSLPQNSHTIKLLNFVGNDSVVAIPNSNIVDWFISNYEKLIMPLVPILQPLKQAELVSFLKVVQL